ncbi:MAG: hypothetical protein ACO1Q7_08965 [Gemmatimonas sp.]
MRRSVSAAVKLECSCRSDQLPPCSRHGRVLCIHARALRFRPFAARSG